MRTVHRLAVAGAAAAVAVVLLALPAGAHVTVNPREAPKGGFTKLSFRVPNERNVATTKIEVVFPAEAPISEVSTRPVAGWTVAVDKDVATDAVSRITWSGGSIEPGEFQEFDISLGPLPDKVDQLVFKALQTYTDGEIVRWIDDPPAAGGEEPEHPAPVLTLTAAADDHHADAADDEDAAATADAPDVDDDDPLGRAAVVMAALALVAAGVALLRGRTR